MGDVIKDAKQRLEGVAPGKWRAADSDIIAESSNRFIATVSEYSGLDEPSEEYANVQLIAAAPELAQALSEETWEYAVAFKSTNGLGYLDRSGRPQPWPLLAAWYLTKEIAQVALINSEYRKETLCIVRRRVSPVEVIDE